MNVERWLSLKRHAVCVACPQIKTCDAVPSIFSPVSACPLQKHPSRDEEIAARAWPATAEPVSGCCDRME